MDVNRSKSQKPSRNILSVFGDARPAVVLIAIFITLPLFVFLSGNHWSSSVVWLQTITITVQQGTQKLPLAPRDKLLGGLLSPAFFDESKCLSRHQSSLYRKPSPHSPSSYLASKLRNYESLHKRCGPNTPLYRKSITQLTSGHSMGLMECNYVVWSPFNGLGNRMLSITSAFLYALLTNRVLLVHQTDDLVDLFCEPFPESTWVLPSDFPVKDLGELKLGSEKSYGNLLKDKRIKSGDLKVVAESMPAYVYLHLEHDYQEFDRLFFCDRDHEVLAKVNWVVVKSDMYFVPGLFLVSQFEDELRWLFPEKETVFHHLGRYLFHPSNTVWGMITRYYISYLAKVEEKVGIQVRTFSWQPISPNDFLDQIQACARQANLLPDINTNATLPPPSTKNAARTKAVLVTSLQSEYSEKLKSMYYEHTSSTGEVISVYQPSHEEQQSSEKQLHNQKALAEMYLLSYCDVLITTGWSTFGYIGQGLAGLKPWILMSPKEKAAPEVPCRRAMSMEPCFHAPPSFDCKAKKSVDMGTLVRHVRHCEDVDRGLKLFD